MNAVTELEDMGYRVMIRDCPNRRKPVLLDVWFEGTGAPDTARARKLMDELERNKAEALVFLRRREMETWFREAFERLARSWIPGIMEHVQRRHRTRLAKIQQADERLQAVWATTLEGRTSFAVFRRALSRWINAYGDTLIAHQFQKDNLEGRIRRIRLW